MHLPSKTSLCLLLAASFMLTGLPATAQVSTDVGGLSQPPPVQDTLITVSKNMFDTRQQIFLAPLEGWLFRSGHDQSWANSGIDLTDWKRMKPTSLSASMKDSEGRVEGWFRTRIKVDSTLSDIALGLSRNLWAATDIYIDGELAATFGNTGKPFTAYNPISKYPVPVKLLAGKEYLIAVHFVYKEDFFTERHNRLKPENLAKLISITGPGYHEFVQKDIQRNSIYNTLWIAVSGLLTLLFWLLVFLNRGQKVFLLIAVLTTLVLFLVLSYNVGYYVQLPYWVEKIRVVIYAAVGVSLTATTLIVVEWVLKGKLSLLTKLILLFLPIASIVAHLHDISIPFGIINSIMVLYFGYLVYTSWESLTKAQWAVIASMVMPTLGGVVFTSIHKYDYEVFLQYQRPLLTVVILSAPLLLTVYIAVRYKEILKEVEEEAQKVLKITEEKNELLSNQNVVLEKQVAERTAALEQSLRQLKTTQAQLIQQEKLASLGQLTAGIAHEIKNPLNFVNNFAELNEELAQELREALAMGEDVEDLLADLEQNASVIAHHGKRADGIVHAMMQHASGGSGQREATDLNALVSEHIDLAYHGKQAQVPDLKVEIERDLGVDACAVKIVPQEIGRVLLNLLGNAFDAVHDRAVNVNSAYIPTVTVSTRQAEGQVEIRVQDNGPGIPAEIREKIFEPFFTTKPTGTGTGLGLSMSYDIVTQGHGGTLRVESEDGEGATFIVKLPVSHEETASSA